MKSIAVLLLGLISGLVYSDDLPDAPEGFSWYVSDNSVGTFLKPDGWHVREEVNGGTNALFITKQKIEGGSDFLTGLSVNQVNDFSRKSRHPPSRYAMQFIENLTKQNTTLERFSGPQASGTMYGARIKGSDGRRTIIAQYLAVGQNDKDRFYLIWYETPEDKWDEHYKTARPMLNMFGLGD